MVEPAQVPLAQRVLAAASRAQDHSKGHAQGVFSTFPMATAKYARHRDRDADYTDTMARMYIPVNSADYDTFVRSMDDPDTQKVLQVLAGTEVASKGGKGYIDFLLQSVTHNLQENVQVSETLSDNYVAYFFGQAPPVFQFSGVLMNTYQDDWTMRMFRLYRDIGRGSQLARHKKVLMIFYDSMLLVGAMMNFNWVHTAELQTASSFSFNFLVKEIRIIYGSLDDPSRPASLGNVGPLQALPPEEATVTTVVGDTGVAPGGAQTDPATLPVTEDEAGTLGEGETVAQALAQVDQYVQQEVTASGTYDAKGQIPYSGLTGGSEEIPKRNPKKPA